MAIIDRIANPYHSQRYRPTRALNPAQVQQMKGQQISNQQSIMKLREMGQEMQHKQFKRKQEKAAIQANQIASDIDTIDSEADYKRTIGKYEDQGFDLSELKTETGEYLPYDKARPVLEDIRQSAVNTVREQKKAESADKISRLQNRRRNLEVKARRASDATQRRSIKKQIKEIDDRINRLTTTTSSGGSFGFSRPSATTNQREIAKDEVEDLLTQPAPGEEDDFFQTKLKGLGEPGEAGTDANLIANVMAEAPNTIARRLAKHGQGVSDASVRNDIKKIARKHIISESSGVPLIGEFLGAANLPLGEKFKLDQDAFLQDVERTFGLTSGAISDLLKGNSSKDKSTDEKSASADNESIKQAIESAGEPVVVKMSDGSTKTYDIDDDGNLVEVE